MASVLQAALSQMIPNIGDLQASAEYCFLKSLARSCSTPLLYGLHHKQRSISEKACQAAAAGFLPVAVLTQEM